jgi:small-conductance mechanosensitive channel
MWMANAMIDWPTNLDVILPLLTRLGGAVLLILLVYVGYRLLRKTIAALEQRQRIPGQMGFVLRRLLRWAALLLAVAVVLQWFGLLKDFWTFLSAMLALVAIGFVAVWSVLSNIMCSIILLVTQPFRVGDVIEFPAQELRGKAVNFNLLFTILLDENGDQIQIPNNLFFQAPIRRKPGTRGISLEEQLEKTENAE